MPLFKNTLTEEQRAKWDEREALGVKILELGEELASAEYEYRHFSAT